MTKSAHLWSRSCDMHGFLTKILQKAAYRPIKVHFFPYKQVSGRNDDHEWLRMTNVFILCDLLWKVMQRTQKEAIILIGCVDCGNGFWAVFDILDKWLWNVLAWMHAFNTWMLSSPDPTKQMAFGIYLGFFLYETDEMRQTEMMYICSCNIQCTNHELDR